jgi:hypothetical protein
MKSTLIKDQTKKVLEAYVESSRGKLSLYLLAESLSREHKHGRTPYLGLDFEDHGYEIFFMSLCPYDQYGSKRHLTKAIGDLYKEINLYNGSGAIDLISSFEIDVLESENLDMAYLNYFRKVETFSEKTKGRFTWTPASTVLMSSELGSVKVNLKKIQESMPMLTELMTLKASHSSVPASCEKALVTLQLLAEEYGTDSASMLSFLIINKRGIQDLGMRLFGKPDDYSDREISILSAEYRIIQYMSESFFKNLAVEMHDVTVNDKDKRVKFYSDQENLGDCDYKVMNTDDRSKWGPNNNTINFAFLAALMCRRTTEAYLPMISLLMMEFKVFEVPPWLPQFSKEIDSYYGVVGKLGRSHMGLGICQNSSSVYGALMSRVQNTLSLRIIKKNVDIRELQVYKSNFNESDDAVISMGFTAPRFIETDDNKYTRELDNMTVESLKDDCYKAAKVYERISEKSGVIYMLMGTLNSFYKCIISWIMREYCSMFASDNSISRCDIKFLYSLIAPQTTGCLTSDLKNCHDSYFDAINSGCTQSSAETISLMNIIKFGRQWKVPRGALLLPSRDVLSGGYPRIVKVDPDSPFGHDTKNHLKFKTIGKYESKLIPRDLTAKMKSIKLSQIAGSRSAKAYRSILTYGSSDTDHIINASPYFEQMGCYGESGTSFIYHQLRNPLHVEKILNEDAETSLLCEQVTSTAKGKRFRSMRFKTSNVLKTSVHTLVCNSYPPVEFINCQTSDEQLILHTMRDRRIGDMADPEVVEGADILLRYEYFSDLINQESTHLGSCTHWMYSDDPEPQMYTKIRYLLSNSSVKVRRQIKTVTCLDLYPNVKYYSGVDSPYYPLSYEREEFRVGNYIGKWKFNGKLSAVTVDYPSEEYILNCLDQKIFDANDKWIEENFKGSKCYLNVWIGDKVETSSSELDDDMFRDPDSNEDLAACMAVQDINVGEEVYEETEEEFEEDFDMMGGLLPGHSYKSCQVSSEFLLFAEDYYRKKVIMNSLVHKCIDQGAIKCSRKRGYLLSSDFDGVSYDRSLIYKLTQVAGNLLAEYSHKSDSDTNQWVLLAMKSLQEHSIMDLLDHSSCFLRHDNRVIFSRKPIGKQHSKQEILRELRSSLFVEL